jgi:hypothetical protein
MFALPPATRKGGSNEFSRVFDPLDLAIIERVYEAALAQVEARSPSHDGERDEERKEALRKRVMICAAAGQFDFNTLYERVVGQTV